MIQMSKNINLTTKSHLLLSERCERSLRFGIRTDNVHTHAYTVYDPVDIPDLYTLVHNHICGYSNIGTITFATNN